MGSMTVSFRESEVMEKSWLMPEKLFFGLQPEVEAVGMIGQGFSQPSTSSCEKTE
jgi:hypothetical protein